MFKIVTRKLGQLVAGTDNVVKALVAATLAGAVGQRTLTLPCKGLTKIRLGVAYTRGGVGATAITATPSLSYDDGKSFVPLSAETVATGVGTVVPASRSFAVSASINFDLGYYDVIGADKLQVVFAPTGAPDAGDKIDVFAIGVETVA
jgi:hypothetical protein